MRLSVKFVLAQALVVGLVSMADPAQVGNTGDTGLPVSVAQAADDIDCVGFDKTDVDHGVEYAIKNSCDKKLTCTVKWKVSCEDSDGKVTQSKSESSSFEVPGTNERTVQASASQCKVSWRIDDVTWSCNEKR